MVERETNICLHADMSHKQEAIDRVTSLAVKAVLYRPPDPPVASLEAL